MVFEYIDELGPGAGRWLGGLALLARSSLRRYEPKNEELLAALTLSGTD